MNERQSSSSKLYRRLPRHISYTTFVHEVFRRLEDQADAQKLVDHIRCRGDSGRWVVGIYIEGKGVVYPPTHRSSRNFNEGFSRLLSWLRERNFQPFDS